MSVRNRLYLQINGAVPMEAYIFQTRNGYVENESSNLSCATSSLKMEKYEPPTLIYKNKNYIMVKGQKEKILELRESGKSYRRIEKILKCSRSTISYHCKKWGLNDIGLGFDKISEEDKIEIKEYYKKHTIQETAEKFNVSLSSVKILSDKKRIQLW